MSDMLSRTIGLPAPSLPIPVAGERFCDILKRRTGTKYAYCENYLVHQPPQDADVVACGDLLHSDVLTDLVTRFSARYPGADRRAIVSMWSMYYFSMLTIGSAVAMLEVKRGVPIGLRDASICIRCNSAEPCAFLIRDAGQDLAPERASDVLYPALREHVEPLVETISSTFNVSRKLLWTNAAGYLTWIVGEVCGGAPEGRAAMGAELLSAPVWPDGGKNPFFDLVRPHRDEQGETCSRRRVCCLRYSLPGVQGCGNMCPLPNGRH